MICIYGGGVLAINRSVAIRLWSVSYMHHSNMIFDVTAYVHAKRFRRPAADNVYYNIIVDIVMRCRCKVIQRLCDVINIIIICKRADRNFVLQINGSDFMIYTILVTHNPQSFRYTKFCRSPNRSDINEICWVIVIYPVTGVGHLMRVGLSGLFEWRDDNNIKNVFIF